MQVVHYLQTVNFSTGFGDSVSFDENGDPLAVYDVMNWQPKPNGSIRVQTVGAVYEAGPVGRVLHLHHDALFWNSENRKVNQIHFLLLILMLLIQKEFRKVSGYHAEMRRTHMMVMDQINWIISV